MLPFASSAVRPLHRAAAWLGLSPLPRSACTSRFSTAARNLPVSFPSVSTVADVTAAAQLLYGSSFLASQPATSVSHVTSVYSAPTASSSTPQPLLTLRVDERSPRSAYDWFALNLSRARASLVVVTGAILRDEPLLTGNVLAEYKSALDAWRLQVLKRQHPAAVCVLTAGPVDFCHPLFHSTEGEVFVYTTSRYFHSLQQQLAAHSNSRPPLCSASSTQQFNVPLHHLQVLTPTTAAITRSQPGRSSEKLIRVISPYSAPSLLTLLQHFRYTHPHITVECGPSTTLPHYARHAGRHVDTLLLSVYSGALDGSVEERCVVPGKELWEQLGSGGGGSGGEAGAGGGHGAGFALTEQWVREQYECVSAARHGDWRFEWHRSKHRRGSHT